MTSSCPNPALVIVILWGISIAATTFLFMGNPKLVYGIVVQGVCMIGSAVYIRKVQAGESCPVTHGLLAVFPAEVIIAPRGSGISICLIRRINYPAFYPEKRDYRTVWAIALTKVAATIKKSRKTAKTVMKIASTANRIMWAVRVGLKGISPETIFPAVV